MIYVASSWRNNYQQLVVAALKEMGHIVYDFKNPPHGNGGFSWSDIDSKWKTWDTNQYVNALSHPIAKKGFDSDFFAMKECDTCVMVLPCGRSANTEAGWMKGKGKEVYVYSPEVEEPELMYKMYDGIIATYSELQNVFKINN